MTTSGGTDDCNSTTEAKKMAAKLGKDEKETHPWLGQVYFINDGPLC